MARFEDHLRQNDLYCDEADREKLESMSEKQREEILYKRYLKIAEIEEKRQLMALEEAPAPAVSEPAITLESCEFVCPRRLLVENVFKPAFSSFRGCFVRVKLNSDYRICKIVGVVEVPPYRLPQTKGDGPGAQTTVALNLDTGAKIIKNFELTNISGNPMEADELRHFLDAFAIENVGLLNDKCRRVKEQMRGSMTDEEVARMVENRAKANPRKKKRSELKIDLILKRDAALAAKDKTKAFFYQQELEKLEDEEKARKKEAERNEMEEARKRLKSNK
ncbi:hypothetical protein PAPHI01_0380 [Pancytospora philotis]|nr:hypothetical protein PAPHI01_0354 [Pancytospora philotis]KAI4291106.1 hypothetical protein PAPHI01_0380 [Pancytospora philotis]